MPAARSGKSWVWLRFPAAISPLKNGLHCETGCFAQTWDSQNPLFGRPRAQLAVAWPKLKTATMAFFNRLVVRQNCREPRESCFPSLHSIPGSLSCQVLPANFPQGTYLNVGEVGPRGLEASPGQYGTWNDEPRQKPRKMPPMEGQPCIFGG